MVNDSWKIERLGNVSTLQRGYNLPHRLRRAGPIPIVTSSGIEDMHCKATVKGPGVVTGRYGTIGKVFFVPTDFWPLNTTLYVRDFHGNDPLFISYLLRTIDFHSHSGKTGVPGVNRNDLHEIEILFPRAKAEQEAIAKALSDADALIESLEQLIAKKRYVKQGAIQKLFRPKDSWVEKRLGDIAEVRDGTHQTPTYVENGVPFFSVENVTSGDFTNTKFISESEHRFLTRSFKAEKGDILMTRIGSIGDCKLIDWNVDASFYVSLALLKIRKGYSAAFICHSSESAPFKRELELNSLQSAIPKKINLGPISNIRIQLPVSLDEQTLIADILTDIDTEITALEAKLAKSRQLKQGMMQELLTGRTRLI